MTLASNLLLASIPILVSYYAEKYRLEDVQIFLQNDPPDFGLPVLETFDFIIVGGGTSGCILANRLSENYTVLLLEAGGDPVPMESVPSTFQLMDRLPDINFVFNSVPQRNSGLRNGGILTVSVGKMMGGSSSHNGMTYQRGHPKDYDRWAEESGDDSWSYQNVLKYFKKSEKYVGRLNLDPGQHGQDGPVHVSEDVFSPGRDIWLAAGQELGYNVSDSNGPQTPGFSASLNMKRNGRRESMYTAYVKPIERTRKNLRIYRYSYVSRIIIDEVTKEAKGVEYSRHGVPRAAFASSEIILSAGAYLSPIILIKSGIGPADQLSEAKVNPISILPVGQHFMDHPRVALLSPILIDKPEYAWNLKTNLTFPDMDEFIHNGTGPVTSLWEGSTVAFIASKRRQADNKFSDWPDIQIFYSFVGDDANAVKIFLSLNSLKTKGSIKLNTTATLMADNNLPLIDYAYFNDDEDLDRAVEGINFVLNVIENTEAFRGIGARYAEKPVEQCRHLLFRSNEYWKCYIRFTSTTLPHGASTCRMGKGSHDPSAVVDSKLRVIGVKNLRVVDASIMPYITNANTCAAVMMIAEKAADSILTEHDGKRVGQSEL